MRVHECRRSCRCCHRRRCCRRLLSPLLHLPTSTHPLPAPLPTPLPARRSHKTFKSPMLTIEARWAGQPGCFGSPYICAIGDTVTGGAWPAWGEVSWRAGRAVLAGGRRLCRLRAAAR